MKSFCLFVVVFLFMGLFSIAAQDLIILRDGNMIEAKVSEISPTEIRYKRFDNLDGPTIVIPADRVLSIRYQNGTQEIINADTKPVQKQTEPTTTALNPDKFIFAFNVNPGGFLSSGGLTSYKGFSGGLFRLEGPSLCLEFGKRKFNSEVNLIFPWGGGFGSLATFNYFLHSRIGGFYLGGGIGFFFKEDSYTSISWIVDSPDKVHYESYLHNTYIFTIGLNIGYKFVTRSGVYFRTGTYVGYGGISIGGGNFQYDDDFDFLYLKPDLAIGYCFK